MRSDGPDRVESGETGVFRFGESKFPLLSFLNRGKTPTLYYVVAAVLLIAFPIYLYALFGAVKGPIVFMVVASLLLLALVSRHYFSLVTEVRVTHDSLQIRGYRRFRKLPWRDIESVTVVRQMDPDYVTFRVKPVPGQTLTVKRFRVWNKGAAMTSNDPVQALIGAIRVQLALR